jgi:hypothetical protein
MIDALFWYTGFLAWVFNLLAGKPAGSAPVTNTAA